MIFSDEIVAVFIPGHILSTDTELGTAGNFGAVGRS